MHTEAPIRAIPAPQAWYPSPRTRPPVAYEPGCCLGTLTTGRGQTWRGNAASRRPARAPGVPDHGRGATPASGVWQQRGSQPHERLVHRGRADCGNLRRPRGGGTRGDAGRPGVIYRGNKRALSRAAIRSCPLGTLALLSRTLVPHLVDQARAAVWSPITRVCMVLLLLNVADGQVATLASAYLGSLGYSLTDIGVLVSLYSVACLVSRVPSGRLADGPQAHRWLVASCLVFACVLLAYPVAVAPWAFWSVRILHGLSFGAATTLNFASFMSVSSNAKRGRSIALYTASWSAGYSIGNLAAGLLADHRGFGVAFAVAGLWPLCAIVLSPSISTSAVAGPVSRPAPSSWKMLLDSEVRAVPVMAFSVNFLNQLLTTLFPLYVLAIGQTLSVVGSARALQSVTNTVVRPLSEPVVRRLGAVRLGSAGVVLSAAAIAVLPFSTAPLVLLAIFIAVGAGRAVAIVSNASCTVELSSRGVLKRGTASALMSAGGDAGSIVAPLLAGATAAHIGIGPALQALAISAALVGVVALRSGRQKAIALSTTRSGSG
jgi:MFS family permease